MRKLQISCIALLIPVLCAGQEPFHNYYERQNAEASRLHNQGEHVKAIAILEELRHRPEVQQSEDDLLHVLYNLACEYSLAHQKDKAMATLRDAAATGSLTSTNLEQDSDFDNIRQNEAFKQFLKELKPESEN
jgi:hypothetical protein